MIAVNLLCHLQPPSESDIIIRKGSDSCVDCYSAFWDNGDCTQSSLFVDLLKLGVTDVYCCGLAFDVCVKHTALDAASQGFRTHVIADACRGVTPEGIAKTKEDFAKNGIKLLQSKEVSVWTCLFLGLRNVVSSFILIILVLYLKTRTYWIFNLIIKMVWKKGHLCMYKSHFAWTGDEILAFKQATFVLVTKKSGGKKWDNDNFSFSFSWGQRDYPTQLLLQRSIVVGTFMNLYKYF